MTLSYLYDECDVSFLYLMWKKYSCDVFYRGGRPYRRDERRMNSETFGVSPNYGGRRGSGYRGNRGGNPRGNRGYNSGYGGGYGGGGRGGWGFGNNRPRGVCLFLTVWSKSVVGHFLCTV